MTTRPAAPSPSPPQQIGRYKIVERIGRGAVGVVYWARDEMMGRDVVVKVLSADFEDEPEIRARFLREAEAAARLSHPNIITIYDVGEERHRFFIVMELLRGSTLSDLIERPEQLPLERVLDLMAQLCSGLGAAHRVGVYHRDIKPGNLFVRNDGILKILDFGIARLSSSKMTSVGFIVGTPAYMSPEQARGETIDARSDIFSAGSVFYSMLSGRKPFAAPDLPTLFHQVEAEDPPPLDPSRAPGGLEAVIKRAMAKDRASRYQSCQEMLADIDAIRDAYLASQLGEGSFGLEAHPVAAPAPEVTADERRTSVETARSATDDTVDYLPDDSQDTVTLPGLGNGWAVKVSAFVAGLINSIRSALGGRARRR